MTATEWLNSETTINRSKRPYAHFDLHTDIGKQRQYISDPNKVASHGFYPFIHYIKYYTKYSKKKGRTKKTRDICYAAHIDRCLYQYYSFLLNSLYNKRVEHDGTSCAAVAYRTDLHKNNIQFSKQAFDFIRSKSPVYIMIGDFTSFFDNLDHAYLKTQWCSLLGEDCLPPDHYAVFKSMTSFSCVELSDLLRINGLEESKSDLKKLNNMSRVLSPEQFRSNRSLIKKNVNPYGIPQGSPISGTLANIYMLDIDKHINDNVQKLGGMYMRYSDDFIIVLPDKSESDVVEELSQIRKMILQIPRLYLEPNKTQYFHFNDGILTNCGKSFDDDADDSSKTINFLGFSFDGNKIRIRAKTISKYYYRMNRKAKGVVKLRSKKITIKSVPTKELYMSYSQKGANSGPGNFLTYVDRAVDEFGNDEAVKQDTRRHMQKIRKALNRKL